MDIKKTAIPTTIGTGLLAALGMALGVTGHEFVALLPVFGLAQLLRMERRVTQKRFRPIYTTEVIR